MSKPTPKHFTFMLLIIISILALVGCERDETSENKSDSKKLYVYNWSYYTPDSVIASFEEEFGVDVVLDYFASNEEMFTKLMASSEAGYDVIFPSGDYVSIMKNLGMLEPLDTSKMENLQYISPLALEKATYDPQMEYSVPYYLGASGIAVNKKMVKEYEKSWNIFADTRYKDRMVMMDDMREVLGDALAYLGYSVNTTNETELEEARVLINTQWKPNLVKFDA
ncbi:MAG: extracellular solute-binding protein, partial [Sphaerochaetaceae bacterium]